MSTYVIYNTKTFELYKKGYSTKTFNELRTAKAQLTKLTSGLLPKLNKADWAVISYQEFSTIEPLVEVTSHMTGQPVKLRASAVGSCVDPSTERYWSM